MTPGVLHRWRRYPKYKESGVEWLGEVPEGWDVLKLKYISNVKRSSVNKKTEDGEKPVQLCNYVDVYYNDYITNDIPFLNATASPDEIENFTLRKGDVMITKDSEDWKDIAVPAYVKTDLPGVLCGYHLAHIRPDEKIMDGEYLFRSFRAGEINHQFRIAANGITRYGIGKFWIDSSLFPVPPLPDQFAIAAFLDRETARIDALIARKKRQIKLLTEKRAVLISHAVTKGLDPTVPMKDSGVEWIGDVPEKWKVLKIKFVASLHSGHTPSRLHPEYWEDCSIPWFSLGDVWQLRDGRCEYLGETKEKISELGLRNSAAELLPAGTVIVSRTASVGFSGIMPVPMATTQDFANWVCGPRILPKFLLYVFRAMSEEFSRLKMGSTHQTIYMPDIEKFRTSLPSIKEQQKIIEFVQTEKKRSEKTENLIESSLLNLHEYRSVLISAAVTGKIDVRHEAKV